MATPVNSIVCCYKDNQPEYLVAGTFNGGVALISYTKEKLVQLIEKKHKSYVSNICSLSTYNDEFVCSISADNIIVWSILGNKIEEYFTIPVDFTSTGDYKWW